MKNFCFCLIAIILCSLSASGQLKSKVDERFEVASIAFRLAEAEEYMLCGVPAYASAIDTYFEPYKDHPLIRHIREIREKDSVAYNAAATISFALLPDKGKIRLDPKVDIGMLLIDEPRFTEKTLGKYVSLLNSFYEDTKFQYFFNANADIYRAAESSMDKLLEQVDPEWFESFYGVPFGKPQLYASITNGPSNYALSSSIPGDDTYGILMGSFTVGSDGMPVMPESALSVIIHEISHNFSWPIIHKYADQMMEAANRIFPYVEEMLFKVAYGNADDILGEGINNLFTNMFFREINPAVPMYFAGSNENYGFVWMGHMVGFMDNFYVDRELYPSIEDFMPQIVGFMNRTADDIDRIMFEYEHRHPYVAYSYPMSGSVISPGIKEIRITFSQKMNKSAGLTQIEGGALTCPVVEMLPKWIDDRTLILTLAEPLLPDTEYGFILPSYPFQSNKGHAMKDDYILTFETSEY